MKIIDLTHQRFGRLLVVSRDENKNGRTYWKCICDCGNEKIAQTKYLRKNGTTSCGCYRAEHHITLATKHGLSNTKQYQQWAGMIARCERKTHHKYKDYGGRGITVCERWRNSYADYLDDMGERPTEEHSLDRIDNDGNYEPSNCRWATRVEQARNQRPKKKRIAVNSC